MARQIGVLPVWFAPMTRHLNLPPPQGVDDGVRHWETRSVKGWLARQCALPEPMVTLQVMRWLVLRVLTRLSADAISEAAGVTRHVVEGQNRAARGPSALARPVRDAVRVGARRRAGATDHEIATHADTGLTWVRLALDGIPQPVPSAGPTPTSCAGSGRRDCRSLSSPNGSGTPWSAPGQRSIRPVRACPPG